MKEKVLVVFYSHSGNTKKIAEAIQNKVGGDIFRIEPVQPYPKDYNNVVKQAKNEIKVDYAPELISYGDDIQMYDIVFIRSPNWWNTVAPPVKSFLRQQNLSGKKIIPFCTHGGGGVGEVFTTIQNECKESIIKKGWSTYGDGSSKTGKLITEWINEIGGVSHEI
jgi:flavodoxin